MAKIPAWALKDAQSVLAEPLSFLINEFISESSFPTDLKKALVSPLYKKGNTEDPTNYRPISVTGALAKFFEQVITKLLIICSQITCCHLNNLDIGKKCPQQMPHYNVRNM